MYLLITVAAYCRCVHRSDRRAKILARQWASTDSSPYHISTDEFWFFTYGESLSLDFVGPMCYIKSYKTNNSSLSREP